MREEAIAELRDLEFREIELRERRHSLKDQIAKLDLRAPVAGIVYGSTADTLRGVIRAAEPVMYIVPKDAPLIVRSRIETIHIDQVHVGQEAALRFSAFDQRTTPEVERPRHRGLGRRLRGRAAPACATTAPTSRSTTGMREKLDDVVLMPGMPVEAFIRTGDRSRAQLLRQADERLLHPRLPRGLTPWRAAGRQRADRAVVEEAAEAAGEDQPAADRVQHHGQREAAAPEVGAGEDQPAGQRQRRRHPVPEHQVRQREDAGARRHGRRSLGNSRR